MNVPNLDSMPPEELQRFATDCQTLAKYAALKHVAMTTRAAGNILVALQFERLCEQLYKQLPTEWRW